ncbi:h [Scenedesmus sp. PABB004]|nr:h [Scenedesmus sp. PABB004] [Scenedesmus sp. PABB004]
MAADGGKLHFSYEQIHASIGDVVSRGALDAFRPTMILAIGGGGFIPARMLRTHLKHAYGAAPPIHAIGLSLYEHDDAANAAGAAVVKTQWLDPALALQGQRVLIVDEVDDTRTTLAYAVAELQRDIAAERAAWLAAAGGGGGAVAAPPTPCVLSPAHSPHDSPRAAAAVPAPAAATLAPAATPAAAAAAPWAEPVLGVFVVHCKDKPKKAALPEQLMAEAYFSCATIPDLWVLYPWDCPFDEIFDHTDRAHRPGSATAALAPSPAGCGRGGAAAADGGAAPMPLWPFAADRSLRREGSPLVNPRPAAAATPNARPRRAPATPLRRSRAASPFAASPRPPSRDQRSPQPGGGAAARQSSSSGGEMALRRAAALLPAGLRAAAQRGLPATGARGYADLNLEDPAILKKFLGVEEALGVYPDARGTLTGMLTELLEAVKGLPEASDYRRAVEATAGYRLKVLAANDSNAAVEEVLDSHMEELILEIKEELALVPLMSSWKPWAVPEDHEVPVVEYTDADVLLNAPPPPK